MLLKLILFYPWLSYSFPQMDAPASPRPSDTFLHEFGTPILLWRVLRTIGYTESPQYSWWEMESTGGIQWSQEMQRKAEKRARKFRKQARLLEQAQKDRNDWEGIAEYRRQQWVKAIREREIISRIR